MKKVIIPLFIAVTLFGSDGRSESPTLVTMEFPPYAWQENGDLKGIWMDIAREAFSRMGQPVSIKVYPWARAIHMMKKGYADGIIGVFKTPEREQYMDYPRTPTNHATHSFFVLKDASIKFNGDLKTLGNHRFCVVRGFSYGKTIDEAIMDGTIRHIRKAPTFEENLKALFLLGGDCILIADRVTCLYHLSRLKKRDQVRELGVAFDDVPTYIAFSKKRLPLAVVERLDRILGTMHADGTVDAIIRRYTNPFGEMGETGREKTP